MPVAAVSRGAMCPRRATDAADAQRRSEDPVFFENLINRGAMPALVTTAVFTDERHRMIAENVANIGVPGYKTKQLDVNGFQRALGKALDERGHDPRKPFVMRDNGQVGTDGRGGLKVTPERHPVENILFHDGTNLSIERQMADLAGNAMMQEMTNTLLRNRFDGLTQAIRGRI
jgi:flagellar basal-body rod protein FlgB